MAKNKENVVIGYLPIMATSMPFAHRYQDSLVTKTTTPIT
jgi:hypothetical protein